MAQIEAYTCICQSCEQIFVINRYITNIVNLDDESDIVIQFLSSSLNKITCPYCKTNFTYETPMLIYSNKMKFAIKVSGDRVLDENSTESNIPYFIFDKAFRYREVNYFIEALEKVRVFSDGLDDKYVEYIKYKLFENTDATPFCDVSLTYKSSDSSSLYFEKLDSNNKLIKEYTIPKNNVLQFSNIVFNEDISMKWNIINRYTIEKYIEKEF